MAEKGNNEALQRAELHRKIWAIADDVRGAVDGWDFKQYILGILFYRFISENMRDYFNKAEHEAGDTTFDYADISDEEAIQYFKKDAVNDKGFFILPSQLFENVVKNINKDKNLNTTLANIFNEIEKSALGSGAEEDFKGLFRDVDVTSDRLGESVPEKNTKLASILNGINELNFGNFEDNHIDTFGDAYEYLISNYASNAGKSGGEFFTPQTVSKLLARIVVDGKTKINKVYDPTCGSGSLLLQMKKFDGVEIEEGYFGQEINMTNYNLARMNMFLHNVNYSKFSIKRGDTLLNPLHNDDKPFDAIVSNPPYSIKWVGDGDPTLINDERFAPAGKLAPKSYADFAFIMHSLSHLSSKGRAAIVCFPGIFYRKGAERIIRKYLVDNNFVDCVIQLPDNLFFGTSIATCVLVLAKNKTENKTLFIDASKQFKKETNNNILEEKNIETIVKEFRNREDVEYFSRYVDNTEIVENDYNLSVSTYVEKEDTREKIDIKVLNKEMAEDRELRIAKLDEIFEFKNGINKGKEFFGKGTPLVSYVNVYKNDRLVREDITEKVEVTEDEIERYSVKKGDILFTRTSEVKDEVGYSSVMLEDIEKCVFNGFVIRARQKEKVLLPKYSAHLFRCYTVRKEIIKRSSFTTRASLSGGELGKVKIFIPPLSLQNKIVKVLDEFQKLVADSKGLLPAEIEQREKQYVYWREKLLTFDAECDSTHARTHRNN